MSLGGPDRHVSAVLLRILILVCSTTAGSISGAWAVQSPEPRLIGYAREAGAQAGLPNLEAAALDSGEVEVRLWDGFGLSGIRGLILRRTGGQWQALRVEPGVNSHGYQVHPIADRVSWGERWSEAVAAGLRHVEPWAERKDGLVARDGYAVVLELKESGRYQSAGSVALDAACGAARRRLLEIAEVLLRENHGCAR